MSGLRVIEGEGRPRFKGEDVLLAAADFVDGYCQNITWEKRAEAILAAAKVIVEAELEF